jgi:hypothetical protein
LTNSRQKVAKLVGFYIRKMKFSQIFSPPLPRKKSKYVENKKTLPISLVIHCHCFNSKPLLEEIGNFA